MHWSQLALTDQIFTHIDPDTKVETTFAATALRKRCELFSTSYTKALVPITSKDAKVIASSRGIEKPRLIRAINTKTYQPLLWVKMLDNTHLLIDGSHTYLAMFGRGIREARAYIVEPHVWKDFIVEGLPSTNETELLNSYSGIPT